MDRIKRSLLKYVFGDDLEIKERLFRQILIAGILMCAVSSVENLLITDSPLVYTSIVATIAIMLAASVATFSYHRTELAAKILGVFFIFMFFPSVFFYSGGTEGGASLWLTMGIIYCFLMFDGLTLKIFVVLDILVNIAIYVLAYLHPEYINPLTNDFSEYLDSIFSVIMVGIVVGLLLLYQRALFTRERNKSLKQTEELEKANNATNAFFANMSHEIRTPINSIVGLNELILREKPGGEIEAYAENIQTASKMLLHLVDYILDKTQLELGQMEIMPVEYDTKDLLSELIDMIHIEANEKKLMLLVDVDRGLPSVLYGDEGRIRQILLNILTNAVKFTPTGSIAIIVKGEDQGNGNYKLTFAVSDTGIGIKKEDLEHLYDAFKRMDIQKNKRIQGSGLGLAITKELVSLMGGELTVDSIYTKGSTFSVTLEQRIVSAEPIGNVDFLRHKQVSVGEYRKTFEAAEANILIVDDNSMNSMVESKLLKETKVNVDIATGGLECLARTKKKFYHVILMDYMMTDMNGIETLRRIRNQENGLCKNSAVLLLTANTPTEAKKLCDDYNFDGFIVKPVTGEALESEIVKFLPDDIVEYRQKEIKPAPTVAGVDYKIMSMGAKRKKKVLITTDCIADIPEHVAKEYDIDIINMYIRTEKGRYRDNEEIDVSTFGEFDEEEGAIVAECPNVDDYQTFFATALGRAENIIHISASRQTCGALENAEAAAQSFDHVTVVDSGMISGGESILCIKTAAMARDNASVEEILSSIKEIKGKIATVYMLPTLRPLEKAPFMSYMLYRFGMGLRAGAVIRCIGGKFYPVVRPPLTGRKSVVRYVERGFKLMPTNKIDDSILVVNYVNYTVAEIREMEEAVKKHFKFKNVITVPTSVTTGTLVGKGSVGVSFMRL
ncbi:MAG: DegV family EDD domain-containing protein [Lachnospiraceae bacterium]|nr:DegV family EDD domain-containing protein [Lachnospiraceae bacterium]